MSSWLYRSVMTILLATLCFLLMPHPATAQEGGGDTHVGDVFGDLYHVKRNPDTGQPILQKRMIEYPEDLVDWGYCPIPVDAFGQEIPFVDLSCEVDPAHLDRIVELDYFGRLSAGRTKERNTRMHFDEVITGIKEAELVTLEPAGRFRLGTGCVAGVCAEWRVIDSPQENLAVYNRLLRYGHIQTNPLEEDVDFHGDPEIGIVYHPALGPEDWVKFTGVLTNVLPSGSCFSGDVFNAACALPQPVSAEDFVRAASFLGGAADKHDKITLDLIQYLNRILKITKATDYAAATLATLPALVRDENGDVAPAADGLPAPADERFVDYAAAAYTRAARFSMPMEVALVAAGEGLWQETPNVGFLDFLRFVNGASAPLTNAPAFVANSLDAVRAVEFIHEYEVPADIRAVGAFTTTSVAPQVAGLSDAFQVLPLMATVADEVLVNGGTVTFTVQAANGTAVGASVVSAPVANGQARADYLLPPVSAPAVLTIIGAYSGAPGFAPSYGISTLTITDVPAGECVAMISPTAATSPPEGGTATVQLTIGPTCTWTAASNVAWIMPAVTSGTGSAAIEYTTERNLTGAPRTGYLTIAGLALVVTQTPYGTENSDFNGDGITDVIWQHTDGTVVVWFMEGVTQVGAAVLATPGDPNWRIAGVGDFNTDGAADLLWHHRLSGDLVVWLMQGTSTAGWQPVSQALPANWKVAGLDDLNGDGYVDLVVQNTLTRETVAWFMNGATRVTTSVLVPGASDSNWSVNTVADYNNDDACDLVWQHQTLGALSLFVLENGAVTSTQPFTPETIADPTWRIVAGANLNGDAYTDLVWQHPDGRVMVWFMNESTMTSSAIIAAPADTGWRVAAAR